MDGNLRLPLKMKQKIVYTKSRHDRLQKERFLLQKEMANFLKYYLIVPAGLESQVKGIQVHLKWVNGKVKLSQNFCYNKMGEEISQQTSVSFLGLILQPCRLSSNTLAL